jgi:predicted RNA binding protein YcfA (HicA-like mRNA interferase family)
VPFHAGRGISPTLLRKIAADIHVTVDESLAAL